MVKLIQELKERLLNESVKTAKIKLSSGKVVTANVVYATREQK